MALIAMISNHGHRYIKMGVCLDIVYNTTARSLHTTVLSEGKLRSHTKNWTTASVLDMTTNGLYRL